MHTLLRILILAILLWSSLALPHAAMALGLSDTWSGPHPKNCGDCHDVRGASYPKMLYRLCQSCHFDGGPGTDVATHSSKTTDTDYGNWDLDCWSCHNPHTQEQNLEWGSIYGQYIKKDFIAVAIKEINPADPGPYYSPIGTLRSITSDMVEFKGNTGFVDNDGLTADDICQVCHENTNNYNSLIAVDTHTDYGPDSQPGGNCTGCHLHTEGFKPTGAAGQAHNTHLTEAYGPQIDCVDCHGLNSPPLFADGNDLVTTTVCDNCHSPGGAFDGVDDLVIGAKNNWPDGVYTGSDLTAGKEQWCVGCHDMGTSVIPESGGRQAPDVAGNNTTYGFYISGHGAQATECGNCHGLDMDHNFDGLRTYLSASNNYNPAFRLKDVGGQPAMGIPAVYSGCNYNSDEFRLCFSCHDEEALLSNTESSGAYGCTTNPYDNAAVITTEFRNLRPEGFSFINSPPSNIHWDHLADINTSFGTDWNSDGTGIEVRTSCPACHNVHGDDFGDGSPTIKMTRSEYKLNWGTDAVGDYGQVGPGNTWSGICSALCHNYTSGIKYYKTP